MLRIGQVEATATQDGKYTDGSVAGGIAATRLRAAAFNAMQEELAHIVESAGLALDINDMTQVLKAIQKLTLSRANPFADIKSDGAAAISTALTNLGLGESKYVIKRGTNANGAWIIWSDGAVEVFGSAVTIVDGLATVTFPVQLPAVTRNISIAERISQDPGVSPASNPMHVSIVIDNTVTTTGFKARCVMASGMASSNGFSWRVYAPV